MKNKLTDLTDHLFAAMERLNDEALTPEQVRDEIARSFAISAIAREIIGSGNLALKATKLYGELPQTQERPKLLGMDEN